MKSVSLVLVLFCGVAANARPISDAERNAVGGALEKALAVMSGNSKAGSKASTCWQMFPNGAPADAATSVTWASCKDVCGGGKHANLLSSKRQAGSDDSSRPITSSERQQVGQALTNALSALGPGGGSASKFESCSGLFPKGEPRQGPVWESCKSVLTTNLIEAAVKVLKGSAPITSSERDEVGAALETALSAMQGKGTHSLSASCDSMFPDGKRDAGTKEDSPIWTACKKVVSPHSSLVEVSAH
jgi:hypothetical protein